ADDAVRRSRIDDHVGRDLAREGTLLWLGRAVLRRDAHVRSREPVRDGAKGREDRRDDDLAVRDVVDVAGERASRYDRLGDRLVHLPVTGDDRFSHGQGSGIGDPYLAVSAATPGNTWPERNSSEAPPPVEMCVIRSSRPACATAATESPPPTTDVAP